jgi:hypothetical protein
VTASQTYTLQAISCCQIPPSVLTVDAWVNGSGNRVIKVTLDGSEQFTYIDTIAGRRNSGRIGLRGSTNANEAVRVNEVIVVEQ